MLGGKKKGEAMPRSGPIREDENYPPTKISQGKKGREGGVKDTLNSY